MENNFLLTDDLIKVIESMTNEQAGSLLKSILLKHENITTEENIYYKEGSSDFKSFKKAYLKNKKIDITNTAISLNVSRQCIYNWINKIKNDK